MLDYDGHAILLLRNLAINSAIRKVARIVLSIGLSWRRENYRTTRFVELPRGPVTLLEGAHRGVIMIDVLVEIVCGIQRWMFLTRMGEPKGMERQ